MCQKKTISNGEVWVKGEKYLPVGSFAQYNRIFLHFVIKSVLDRPELLMDVVKLKGRALSRRDFSKSIPLTTPLTKIFFE